MKLPPLPGHRVEVLQSTKPPPAERRFLDIDETKLVARFADGVVSEPFAYSIVLRGRLDAIVVVPHFQAPSGERMVVLRSALRPPVALRPMESRPIEERASLGELWEVPAGLVEPDELSPEGLRRCAARELFEETGFRVDVAEIRDLGPSMFPAPALIGERHFYFHAVIDPSAGVAPTEDGSVLERQAELCIVPLELALEACRTGEIEDLKTELALRRLREV
jgi:ADP-ribose pyrophosphatase